MPSYTPFMMKTLQKGLHYAVSSMNQLKRDWDEFSFGVSRPTQLARGQYQPRFGLSPSQNAFIDMFGFDDRALLSEDTKVGKDYLYTQLVRTRPAMKNFRETTIGEIMRSAPEGRAILDDASREFIDSSVAEAATDPLMIGPTIFRGFRGLAKAAKYNRFSTGAVPNWSLFGRLYSNMELKPNFKPLGMAYQKAAPMTATGRAPMAPFIQTPNHFLTEILHEKVYGYYRPNPTIDARRALLPANLTEQAIGTPKASQLRSSPDRMDSETYINWLLEPHNEEHRAEVLDIAQKHFGRLGLFIYDAVPTKQGQLIRPDERSNAMTKTDVPQRKAGSSASTASSGAQAPALGEAGQEGALSARTIYDNALAVYSKVAQAPAELDRMASAGVWRYYENTYQPSVARQYFNTYRMDDPADGKKMRDALIEANPDAYKTLHESFISDKSTGADQIRLGFMPNTVDLGDFDSVMYWTGPSEAVRSPVLTAIQNDDIAGLPWIMKPANLRHYGYSTLQRGSADPKEKAYVDYLDTWFNSTGRYNHQIRRAQDNGAMFEEFIRRGDFNGDMESVQDYLTKNPQMRDMFFNPRDGNVYNLKEYLKRSDRNFLEDIEAAKLGHLERKPYEPRFGRRYPLVRLPGDVTVGPLMRYNGEEGYLDSGMNDPRTHLEMQRVKESLLQDKSTAKYNSVVNESVRHELIDSGFRLADAAVYDPYHGTAYGGELIDMGVQRSMQPYRKAVNAITDLDRREKVMAIVDAAQERLKNTYRRYMVGGDGESRGLSTLLRRMTKGDMKYYDTIGGKEGSPYSLPDTYYASEEVLFESLSDLPEFKNVEDPPYLSEVMDELIPRDPQKRPLSEGFLDSLRKGLPEAYDNQIYSAESLKPFVDAGGVVMHMSPIMMKDPVNSYGIQAPAMVPATADMIMTNIREVTSTYAKSIAGMGISEQGIMAEDVDPRNVYGAPISIADRSLTNMIESAASNSGRFADMTNAATLDKMPAIVKDNAAGKFFDGLRNVDVDQMEKLGLLPARTAYESDMLTLADSSDDARDGLQEYIDSYMWPGSEYTVRIELPEGAQHWSSPDIYKQYSDKVRQLFLQHPEIMRVNLMTAYEDVLEGLQMSDTMETGKRIGQTLEHLAYQVMPNYELCVGQDPMARTHLISIMDELGAMDQTAFEQDLPEVVQDIKSLIYHMDGKFGSYHDGMMWQTTLRALKVPEGMQNDVMGYIEGYTNDVLTTSESIVEHQQQAIYNLLNVAQAGKTLGKGWIYDVNPEDIKKLSYQVGIIDRPIHADPSVMTMASDLGGQVEHIDGLLKQIQKQKTPLTPEQFEYLEQASEELDRLQVQMQSQVREHYFESLYNLAYDPDVTPKEMSTYFNVQPTAMKTISENPAALAIANAWDSGFMSLEDARKEALAARASGAITQKQFKGLEMLAEFKNLQTRHDAVDMLFDVYAAHRPNLPEHVTHAIMANRASKYGPDWQRLVSRLKEDPEFSEFFITQVINDHGGNYFGAMMHMANTLDIPILPFAKVYFQQYPVASKQAFKLMAKLMTDSVAQRYGQ